MFVCCECCVLSGRGLCDELITRTEEFYRLWCIIVCDLETSRMRRPWSVLGRSATGGGNYSWNVLLKIPDFFFIMRQFNIHSKFVNVKVLLLILWIPKTVPFFCYRLPSHTCANLDICKQKVFSLVQSNVLKYAKFFYRAPETGNVCSVYIRTSHLFNLHSLYRILVTKASWFITLFRILFRCRQLRHFLRINYRSELDSYVRAFCIFHFLCVS